MKILTINGSGTGGYRAIKFLSYLEKELNKPLHETFDMIVGVSSGSIVGAFLASGNNCENTTEKFKAFMPEIFKDPKWFIRCLFSSKYDIKNLVSAAKKNFDIPMSDMRTKYMTYALAIDGDYIQPRHWKSWKDTDTIVYNALVSSCCAPSYFDPYKFSDKNKGLIKETSFVDGGVYANNPSMSALTEAIKLGSKIEDITIVNVGSGKHRGGPVSEYKGLIKIAQNLPFDIMAATERVDEYQGNQLLGDRCINVFPEMTPTDYQDLEHFDQQAEKMWKNKKDAIIDKLK